jgi:hypothetical protein
MKTQPVNQQKRYRKQHLVPQVLDFEYVYNGF